MKPFKFLIILTIIIFLFSCKNNSVIQEDVYYKAVVVNKQNIDCGKPLIMFTDTTSLPGFLKDTLYGFYPYFLALKLPDILNIEGLKIKIKFREPINEELPVCTRMGPTYSCITILSAMKE